MRMTEELINLTAEKYKIDFFTIEVTPREGYAVLRAPYMTKAFIKEIERLRPVVLFIQYKYTKGLIN